MPVTAKLSRLFYDRLGEEIADELVNWFNAVDATYRADLRDLNELNFARFDAKLEQRGTELYAKLDSKIDRVAAELNARIDRMGAELNARLDQRAAEITAQLERRLGEQTRWLFVAWASLLIPMLGLWLRR